MRRLRDLAHRTRRAPDVDAAAEGDQVRLTDVASDLVPRMLKVTLAMGGSSAAVIAMAAARAKVVAVDLGPEGVGSLTLLISFLSLATLLLGLGMSNSAIKEIASADATLGREKRDDVRLALYAGSLILAAAAALLIGVAAGPISTLLGGGLESETRWSAIAAFATIVGAAAVAELTGFRRIRAVAILQAVAAALATLATVGAWLAGIGLLPVVLVAPSVATAAIALIAVRSLPRSIVAWSLPRLLPSARRLVGLGVAFILNAALAASGALVIRVLIQSELGRADTGQFQAAFAIAGYYLSFVFAALATDYLPLLSGISEQRTRLNQAANTQLLVALLLSGPAVLGLIAGAPYIVPLFYSDKFTHTPELLQIMLLGELMRIGAWTVGYILVARAARVSFVMTELLYNVLLVSGTALLLPGLGLNGAATAYLLSQVGSLAVTLVFVQRTSGFRLSRSNLSYLLGYGLAAAIVYVLSDAGGTTAAFSWSIVLGALLLTIHGLLRHSPTGFPTLRRLLALRAAPQDDP